MEAKKHIQVALDEEMRRSYLDYAMSVIIGRALPDVRDGFKPVHRRILWAMHELGNTHNKPFKKSARIVGDCFVKGELVHTETGLAPIEEVNKGDYVRLADGSLSKVVEAYHNPPSHVIDVTLSNGLTLTVTPGQRFRVLRDNLTIAWEEARNLTGKRVLVTNPRLLGMPTIPPDTQKSDLAYVCGLAVAEGYGAHWRNKSRVNINMTDPEPIDFLTEFCAARNDRSFFRSTVQPKKAHYKLQHHVAFSGVREAYEACAHTSAHKIVPAWILADRRLFAPFVAGFTDGDGYIRQSASGREVILVSTSKVLLTQIQSMLADSGIHGTLTQNTAPQNRNDGIDRLPSFVLSFTGTQASLFCRFVHDYLKVLSKQQSAALLMAWQKRVLNTATDCLPSKSIFAELSHCHLGGGWYLDQNGQKFRAGIKYPGGSKIRYERELAQRDISYRQLQEWGIFDKLARLGSPLLPQLKSVVDNYCVLKVVSVEDRNKLAETYDIQIEHESHEFVLHGCAVSNCIGKYHPHGDSAAYETIVRMVQPFSLRYPLIDGQGNFGSVDGDDPAAMRYTEVRMGRITTQVLADVEKETVDFQPNYDESLQEPLVLPVRFPHLLVNGASGIAVGMATNIPPHNLGEVIDATIYLMQNPDADLKALMKYVQGPDFPTGGFIYGRAGIKQAYETGRGTIIMRARAAIDKVGRGSAQRDAIVITEIPYQVIKSKLVEKIADLVNERRLEGISDLRDESDREGMRIVIELKREAVPQIILNNLYKLTPMQSNFGVINLSIVNGQPKVLNLKETLEEFIYFRRETIRRRTNYELDKVEARAHILEGLKRALDQIDAVIKIIRAATSTPEARAGLIANFHFSEKQAQAILDMQLQRLTGLERQKLVEEYAEIIKKIAELREILANEQVLKNVIIEELKAIRKDFADERRTQIINEEAEFTLEDLIPDEEVVITVTQAGFIKRTPLTVFTQQSRGGKGRYGISLRGEDFVTHVFVATTHSYIMVFTDQGKVYNFKVHEIPEAQAASRGKAIANIANISASEKVAGVIAVREFAEDKYVVMVTRKGVTKKTQLSEFDNMRFSGLIAMTVDKSDELISTEVTDGEKKIFLATHNGLAICFNEADVRPMGRPARGVRGIKLGKGDYVVSVCAVSGNEQMLSITEKGYGKQTPLTEYRVQSRGGKGVINVKTMQRNGKVVAVMPVKDDDEVMIMTSQGKVVRLETSGIRETGRSAQGVRVITLGEDDEVASASLVGQGQEEIDKTD